MADAPIGISFLPTADAAANGPRQAGIEGQGGSDLAAAFKILSLHLPRVLGAAAIAPKRLLNSQGSAAIGGSAGANPYAQVFQALLQSISGGMGGPAGGDVQSLASLFGGNPYGGPIDSGTGGPMGGGLGGGQQPSGAPPPAIIPGSDLPRAPEAPVPPAQSTSTGPAWEPEDRGDAYSTRYI